MKHTTVILLFIGVFGVSCRNAKEDRQQQAEKVVKLYLDSSLNDPHSYESVKFGNLSPLGWDGIQTIEHKYRAKNGFGGYVVKTDFFHLDSTLTKVDCCYRK